MKAQFNNAEHDFTIADIACFEATLPGGSAYALLKKFTDAQWSATDVAHVISFALHGPAKDTALYWRFRRDAARYGMPARAQVPYKPHPDVAAVVNAVPGEYAELAANILTEAIFGAVAVEAADAAA